MDENTNAIILNLIANAIFSLAGKLGTQIDSDMQEVFKKDHLQSLLEDAAEEIELHPPYMEQKCLFLSSPSAESIVREIFSSRLQQKSSETLQAIEDSFVKAMTFYIGCDEADILSDAKSIFACVLNHCVSACELAVQNDCLLPPLML